MRAASMSRRSTVARRRPAASWNASERLAAGGDDDRDFETLARGQCEPVFRALGVEPRRRRVEAERGRAHHAVETPIAQAHDFAAVHPRGQRLAAARPRMAADLEHVHEVGREGERELEVVAIRHEALDGEPLVELSAENRDAPQEPRRPAWQHDRGADEDVRVGEVDGRLQRVVGEAGVEHEAALAVQPELEQAQEPRVIHVESVLAGDVRQVTAPVRDEECGVVLENQLGEIGGDARGEDVVVLADDEIVTRALVRHAARASADASR
jgi:hypothetical protein